MYLLSSNKSWRIGREFFHDKWFKKLRRRRNINESPSKRSFRGPGGINRGLESATRPKSVRGNWPLWSFVVLRGLWWPPVDNGTDDMYISFFKVSNKTLGPKLKCQSVSTIKRRCRTPTVKSHQMAISTH